nr:MAG TPA: hypothetical protein [Caudoviricetes sp.]
MIGFIAWCRAHFLYFLKGGHRLDFLVPFLLTIIIISDFLEKSIPFSKKFLKIFFRRSSSNYFLKNSAEALSFQPKVMKFLSPLAFQGRLIPSFFRKK